jgi:hypothetical protein
MRMKNIVAALAVALCACASDEVLGPPDSADAQRIAPRLAVTAIAIGVATQGAGFLDNFLPCGRRGIINFHSTSSQTRRATFSGCNLGDSVVVDGVVEIYWSGTRNQALQGATSVSLQGDLNVTVAGRRSRVSELAITSVQFPDPFANVFRLRVDSLRVDMNGASFRPNSTHAARGILDPQLAVDALPATDLNALTEADLKRIAYDAGLVLAWYMATNVRQTDPGPVVVQTPCGLTHVQWDAQMVRTWFHQQWLNCRLFGGMLVSGNFDMRMPGPAQITTTLQLVTDGTLVFSGAIPTTSLTHLEWSITLAEMPGMARIAGVLQAGNQQRQFSFDMYVDD